MARKDTRGREAEGDPAWSFDQQGDYAISRTQRIERIAAIAITLLWAGLVFRSSGFGDALRSVAFYLIPLACIWRPDLLGGIGMRVSPFTAIDGPTPERVVRICGWLWLFFPVWIYLAAKLFMQSLE
ncbi:hypothetical protein [Luteolibacter sp. Populi]|uniref:hypothetical protein n=1 Tax=Luteolibacter sp. Populi TaxID=3230487 RepID=UPI00346714F8